jgi:hypothetical protein
VGLPGLSVQTHMLACSTWIAASAIRVIRSQPTPIERQLFAKVSLATEATHVSGDCSGAAWLSMSGRHVCACSTWLAASAAGTFCAQPNTMCMTCLQHY